MKANFKSTEFNNISYVDVPRYIGKLHVILGYALEEIKIMRTSATTYTLYACKSLAKGN